MKIHLSKKKKCKTINKELIEDDDEKYFDPSDL